MKTATVILAAGKGKRMKNPEKSKVMYELAGKPLIEYVVNLALKIKSEKIIIVVGHQKKSVLEFINKKFNGKENPEFKKIYFAHQDKQLGTGHAVIKTKKYLGNYKGIVLILSGDVPLLREKTLNKFIEYHRENKFRASLISAVMDNPSGYGRIIRDSQKNFTDIKEEKDTSEKQKKIKEINSGIYLTDSKILFEALKTLRKDNAQKEYYLTDVFKYFRKNGYKIGAFRIKDRNEISGINTLEQLILMQKQSGKIKQI
ncbi:MAG: UDP-N-acetylglucosamine pyrophosphorylase [Ignavibacteria bacterium]|nr:UDP-N-acetylglucosamine pyrophosphorylase [Ignavibacteria bacterium]